MVPDVIVRNQDGLSPIFGIQGSALRVYDSVLISRSSKVRDSHLGPTILTPDRYAVSVFGFRVPGHGFQFSSFGFQVPSFRFRVSGFWFLVSGFGFWVSGS